MINKANRVAGLLFNSFKHIDLNCFRNLYCVFVRPLLEYGSVVWYPTKIKDVDAIERVQRKTTKKAPGLRNYSYEERLRLLQLPTLEERRYRGDLIHIFKIIRGFVDVRWANAIKSKHQDLIGPKTRGHKLQYNKESFKDSNRMNFFVNRVANNWNSLPENIVMAENVNQFKAQLDIQFKLKGTYNFSK